MARYDERARAAAGRALAPISRGGKGQEVTIVTTTPGVFDPVTSITPVVVTTQIGSGVEEAYRAKSIDGSLILVGDKKLILSPFDNTGALMVQPVADKSTVILENGSKWTVKHNDPLSPAGLVILSNLQLRGAG